LFALLLRLIVVLWALPCPLLGLGIGSLGLLSGGKARIRSTVVEFHGGAVKMFVRLLPPKPSAVAITFGHTILGKTGPGLDMARGHELVHVRQYERWGPLFGPAYLLASLVLWLRGKDPYRDNPFEREAFENDRKGYSQTP